MRVPAGQTPVTTSQTFRARVNFDLGMVLTAPNDAVVQHVAWLVKAIHSLHLLNTS